MTLDEAECWARLAAIEHAVLGTVHPARGVDLVPVVFVPDLEERRILVPIDTVKAKSGRRLQRLENLGRDPRCSLLVEEYSDDWSTLWWVRLHGHGTEVDATTSELALFGARYRHYRALGAVASMIAISPTEITGWAAE